MFAVTAVDDDIILSGQVPVQRNMSLLLLVCCLYLARFIGYCVCNACFRCYLFHVAVSLELLSGLFGAVLRVNPERIENSQYLWLRLIGSGQVKRFSVCVAMIFFLIC